MKISNARKLTTAALIIAVDIIITRFFSYMMPGGFDRLSLQFIPHALAGYIFGPLGAAVTCVAGDILGMFVNSAGLAFSPYYTFSAAVRGIIYGLILRGRPVRFAWSLLAVLLVTFVVDLGINPVWSMLLYGRAWLVVMIAKVPVRLVTIPIYGGILFGVLNGLKRTIPKF